MHKTLWTGTQLLSTSTNQKSSDQKLEVGVRDRFTIIPITFHKTKTIYKQKTAIGVSKT